MGSCTTHCDLELSQANPRDPQTIERAVRNLNRAVKELYQDHFGAPMVDVNGDIIFDGDGDLIRIFNNNPIFISNFTFNIIGPGGDVQGGVPRGVIVAWYGDKLDVPSGWRICDGREGTPQIGDGTYICGASSTYGSRPNDSGGAMTHSHEPHVSHYHLPGQKIYGVDGTNSPYGTATVNPNGEDALAYTDEYTCTDSHYHTFTITARLSWDAEIANGISGRPVDGNGVAMYLDHTGAGNEPIHVHFWWIMKL